MVSDIKFLSFLMDFCRSCNTLKPEGVVYQCTNLLTWNINVKKKKKKKMLNLEVSSIPLVR